MGEKDEEILTTLKEILKWIRFSGAKEVQEVLKNALNNEVKVLVYHYSDGKNGSVEIGKIANVSDKTVRTYWASWARLGIVEAIRVRGGDRYKKTFNLEDFDFKIPTENAKK